MKRLLFVAITLLLGFTAEAEVRGYGALTLDFTRARKIDQTIVVPAKNGQKRKFANGVRVRALAANPRWIDMFFL